MDRAHSNDCPGNRMRGTDRNASKGGPRTGSKPRRSLRKIQAIVDGGLWPRTVVFVTWDDWGGWYDHVVPPNVEKWDSRRAQYPGDAHPEFDGQQFRYGSRVPCLVISPYARKGFVSPTQRSHISLVKFCQNCSAFSPSIRGSIRPMICPIVLIRRKRRSRHRSFRHQPRWAAAEVGERRGRYPGNRRPKPRPKPKPLPKPRRPHR